MTYSAALVPPVAPRPLSPRAACPEGASSLVWLFALFGVGTGLCLLAAIVWFGMHARQLARSAQEAPSTNATLPPVQRKIPKHAVAFLEGCTDADLARVATGIIDAIDVGAPLYNAGNFVGCYPMCEGTAADLERGHPAACTGPKEPLEAGRTKAASLAGASAQAWARRDAFDGFDDVIARRLNSR